MRYEKACGVCACRRSISHHGWTSHSISNGLCQNLGWSFLGGKAWWHFFTFLKNYIYLCVCTCVCINTHTSAIACMWRFKGSHRSWFPSTFTWVAGLKLTLSGFGGKHLYQLSQFIGPGDTCSSSFITLVGCRVGESRGFFKLWESACLVSARPWVQSPAWKTKPKLLRVTRQKKGHLEDCVSFLRTQIRMTYGGEKGSLRSDQTPDSIVS